MKSNTFFRIIIKTISILFIANLLFALIFPLPILSKASLYNSVFPGRNRFPFGETPDLSYSFTMSNLDALFASHEISDSDEDNQFKVVIIGNSTVWGHYLEIPETLTEVLNQHNLSSQNDLTVKFYNLGYPSISVAQDLLILKESINYQPDLIIWLFTLEGFPKDKHLSAAIGKGNQESLSQLFPAGFLPPTVPSLSLWEKSMFGQRQQLNQLIRLQLYGAMWAATGIDHFIPKNYQPRANDLEENIDFHNLPPAEFNEDIYTPLYLNIAHTISDKIPIILINQPIFIAGGKNTETQYNYFYPKWAYDLYRKEIQTTSIEYDWNYFDLWKAVDNDQFTNSAVHLTPSGIQQLAMEIESILLDGKFLVRD